MLEPRVGKRGEIRVVAENILCAFILFQLNEEAVLADVDVERIVNLAAMEVSSLRISFTQRRQSQVNKGSLQARPAESAPTGCGLLLYVQRKCHGSHVFSILLGIWCDFRRSPFQQAASSNVGSHPSAPPSATVGFG